MIGDRLKFRSADVILMAACQQLIGSGCDSIVSKEVLHAMYIYGVFVLTHVLNDLCLAQIRRLRLRSPDIR